MVTIYNHIKDLFNLSRQNKFFAFLIILTLQLCTVNKTYKTKLNWLLFENNDLYYLIDTLIFIFCTFTVVLMCANIAFKGMFHLFYSIEFDRKYPRIDDVGDRYQWLLHCGNSAEILVLPSILTVYFLTVIMSVHTSFTYAFNYTFDQFSWYHYICILLSSVPFGILTLYNKKAEKNFS